MIYIFYNIAWNLYISTPARDAFIIFIFFFFVVKKIVCIRIYWMVIDFLVACIISGFLLFRQKLFHSFVYTVLYFLQRNDWSKKMDNNYVDCDCVIQNETNSFKIVKKKKLLFTWNVRSTTVAVRQQTNVLATLCCRFVDLWGWVNWRWSCGWETIDIDELLCFRHDFCWGLQGRTQTPTYKQHTYYYIYIEEEVA